MPALNTKQMSCDLVELKGQPCPPVIRTPPMANRMRILLTRNLEIGIPARSSQYPCMKIATVIARVLLGLIFVVFGSNIFLHFIPMPPPSPGLVGDFTKALFLSHYLHVVAVFQIVGGLLLLIGRFVPLGLLLLAPVIVNIDLVHILMDPSGLPMASVISILLVFLVWRYRDAFAGLVRP
jgi:putative oxidoreductase